MARADDGRSGNIFRHSTGPLAADQTLTWCIAKQWLLDHMPDFDKVDRPLFLPLCPLLQLRCCAFVSVLAIGVG